MASDVYNLCGGSAYKLPSGNYLVAFTAMSAALDERNATRPRTSLAWEIDADGAQPGHDADAPGPQVRTSLRFPIPHGDAGSQNAYRVIPWHSIDGEGASEPW